MEVGVDLYLSPIGICRVDGNTSNVTHASLLQGPDGGISLSNLLGPKGRPEEHGEHRPSKHTSWCLRPSQDSFPGTDTEARGRPGPGHSLLVKPWVVSANTPRTQSLQGAHPQSN